MRKDYRSRILAALLSVTVALAMMPGYAFAEPGSLASSYQETDTMNIDASSSQESAGSGNEEAFSFEQESSSSGPGDESDGILPASSGEDAPDPSADFLPGPVDIGEEDAILSESTDSSTVFDLGHGKRLAIFYAKPVRFEEAGKLIDYDPSLTDVTEPVSESGTSLSGYAYENTASDARQYFPEELSEETPVLMENGAYSIALAPKDASFDDLSTASEQVLTPYEETEAQEVTAVYEKADEKLRYEYTSLTDGVKETLVLTERPDGDSFSYALTLTGLTPVKGDHGISLTDSATGKE